MKKLIDHLSGFITENRKKLFEQVLDSRTRYITVVLEDIYQPQNASAVLRSCECFGIQDVNIIENKNEYQINPEVVMGASKWLNIHKFQGKEFNTPDAISDLRSKGYRIIATTCREGAVDLNDFDVQKGKFALFFGTELTGLTGQMLEQADEFVRIPMHGFTDSFNISVSAAIILHHLRNKLLESGVDWKLGEKERDELMIEWLHRSIKHLHGKSPEDFSNLE
ncbi:TrmH family RNA methyltransferase [Bacteroidota bacterium]